MNLYEYEGKQLFTQANIPIPKGQTFFASNDLVVDAISFDTKRYVIKAQTLSGKRGKNNGIQFADTKADAIKKAQGLFKETINKQPVAAVRIEEAVDFETERYLSCTYNTKTQQPMLLYSAKGGIDIEDETDIKQIDLDIRTSTIPHIFDNESLQHIAQALYDVFVHNDARVVEINPLAEQKNGTFVALDAKVALDDDAFYRHEAWQDYPARTMMGRPPTDREVAVQQIDSGEGYYRGTAGKYVELDGTIGILFSGGGASIANMDALIDLGLSPANYTEYSGNPPREKVYELAKIVMQKPGLEGLWIAGGVANFTNVKETFQGIIDALDEIKPTYPIVIRRAGPFEQEGIALMQACAKRNNLTMHIFGKETPMGETAKYFLST